VSAYLAVVPNPSFQGTAGKLRLPVPSALRAPAAPELKRWASMTGFMCCLGRGHLRCGTIRS
jgi:hypothetical protein